MSVLLYLYITKDPNICIKKYMRDNFDSFRCIAKILGYYYADVIVTVF